MARLGYAFELRPDVAKYAESYARLLVDTGRHTRAREVADEANRSGAGSDRLAAIVAGLASQGESSSATLSRQDRSS